LEVSAMSDKSTTQELRDCAARLFRIGDNAARKLKITDAEDLRKLEIVCPTDFLDELARLMMKAADEIDGKTK
jgi:hypothetical protein